MAHPMWRSISTIFSTDEVSRRVEVTRFSTPRITPSEVATPIAVDPSLIASREYSTWKRRPSGEKVLREEEGRLAGWCFGCKPDRGAKTLEGGSACADERTYLIPRSKIMY